MVSKGGGFLRTLVMGDAKCNHGSVRGMCTKCVRDGNTDPRTEVREGGTFMTSAESAKRKNRKK